VLAGGRDSGLGVVRAVDVRALTVGTMLHKNVDDAKKQGRDGIESHPRPAGVRTIHSIS